MWHGKPESPKTLSGCQVLCVNNMKCTGLDWNPSTSVPCWLHGPWSGGMAFGRPAVTHYNLTRKAGCGICYDILLLLEFVTILFFLLQRKVAYLLGHIVSNNGTKCDPDKIVFIAYWLPSTNVEEGSTDILCIVYVELAYSGIVPFSLRQHGFRVYLYNKSTNNDFVAFEGCLWGKMENTNVLHGIAMLPTTLSDCKELCVNTGDCTGFDWVPSSSKRCWFHGPWSGRWQIGGSKGLTHYNLTREAECGSSYGILLPGAHFEGAAGAPRP